LRFCARVIAHLYHHPLLFLLVNQNAYIAAKRYEKRAMGGFTKMTELTIQYTTQAAVLVEVDPQAVLAAYNHAKGMAKLLGTVLGRRVFVLELGDDLEEQIRRIMSEVTNE